MTSNAFIFRCLRRGIPPYPMTVCLRVEHDPMLTPLFVNSLRRQVKDQLSHSFGPLATVQVVSTGHWLVDEFPNRPISEPEWTAELNAARAMRERVFLVGIEYDDAAYRVSCRLIDGERGYVGLIDHRQTPDRQWVTKSVCLAVKDNFAVVAKVLPSQTAPQHVASPSSARSVSLDFLGHEQKEQLAYLLRDDCVLQPYAIFRRRSGQIVREAVPMTLLYWRSRPTPASAKVVTNLANPWQKRPGLEGFEALKLHTQSGRIRLKLVDRKTAAAITNTTVSANDRGFDDHTHQDLLEHTDRDGVIFPTRIFQHVAYVQIKQGGGGVYNMPIPIVRDVCEQLIRIDTDSNAGPKAEFDRKLRFLSQDVQTLVTMQAEAVRKTNELNGEKRHEAARDCAAQAVHDLQPLLFAAQGDLLTAKETAQSLKLGDASLFKFVQEQLVEIKQRHNDLQAISAALERQITTRQAQDRANTLLELGKQLETQGNIDEAIGRYELALVEQPNQPDLKVRIEKMKEGWRIKSDAHRDARRLIVEEWAKAQVTDVEMLLPKVEQGFDTLRAVGDRFTALRLAKITGEIIPDLQALVEHAASREGESDREEAEKFAGLVQKMADFQERVAAYCEAQ